MFMTVRYEEGSIATLFFFVAVMTVHELVGESDLADDVESVGGRWCLDFLLLLLLWWWRW